MKLKKLPLITLAVLIITMTITGIATAQPPENPLEFNEGLVLSGNDFKTVNTDSNKTIHFHAFDQKTGTLIPDDEIECHHHLYQTRPYYENLASNGNFTESAYGKSLYINNSYFQEEGEYSINIRCNTTQTIDGEQVEKGGFARYDFQVRNNIKTDTDSILWACPTDWNFPIVFMIITLIILTVAFTQQSTIMGILGGVMTIASYLYIGACSPLFLSPILIIGILTMIRFATGGD